MELTTTWFAHVEFETPDRHPTRQKTLSQNLTKQVDFV